MGYAAVSEDDIFQPSVPFFSSMFTANLHSILGEIDMVIVFPSVFEELLHCTVFSFLRSAVEPFSSSVPESHLSIPPPTAC